MVGRAKSGTPDITIHIEESRIYAYIEEAAGGYSSRVEDVGIQVGIAELACRIIGAEQILEV